MYYYVLMVYDPYSIDTPIYPLGVFTDQSLAEEASEKYNSLHKEEEDKYTWVEAVHSIENGEDVACLILDEGE